MLYNISGDIMNKRRENFLRIAQNRTNKIINMIYLLGNLSNKSYYEYEMEEINKIFDAIQHELNNQRRKFVSTNKREKFRL